MSLNYNAATNRITTYGYSYEANGNLTAAPNLTLDYDVENRLVRATHWVNGTDEYAYDPAHRRVWKRNAGGVEETHFYGPDGRRLGVYYGLQGGGAGTGRMGRIRIASIGRRRG